jgi:hypothetical protein
MPHSLQQMACASPSPNVIPRVSRLPTKRLLYAWFAALILILGLGIFTKNPDYRGQRPNPREHKPNPTTPQIHKFSTATATTGTGAHHLLRDFGFIDLYCFVLYAAKGFQAADASLI